MTTRQFTRAELAEIGVPPDSPEEVEYSDVILEDRQVTVLGYVALRECVFLAPDDGLTYSVNYNGPINSGSWEIDDSGVPYGLTADTVEATQVEQVLVVTEVWEPVDSATAAEADDEEPRSALQQLVDLYEEAGAADPHQQAGDLLALLAEEAGAERSGTGL